MSKVEKRSAEKILTRWSSALEHIRGIHYCSKLLDIHLGELALALQAIRCERAKVLRENPDEPSNPGGLMLLENLAFSAQGDCLTSVLNVLNAATIAVGVGLLPELEKDLLEELGPTKPVPSEDGENNKE